MLNTYPISVVLSATTGVCMTSISFSGWRGIKDLCHHLNASPENVAAKIFEQHPELDVDTSSVTDWENWMLDMRKQFGGSLKFEGRGS